MLYIKLSDRQIKVFALKKTLLGQYEVDFYEKTHETPLMERGKVQNVDILASAVKEALSHITENQEKDVYLILPQDSFEFLRADVPTDIAPTAVAAFVQDKARAQLSLDMDASHSSYIVRHSDASNKVSFYAISQSAVDGFAETLNLLGYKLASIIPETLAVFKLFDKTLRREKLETILYVSYQKDRVEGYLYDSNGLVTPEKWSKPITDKQPVEQVLKSYIDELGEKSIKLNRIILSGESSEGVRQDTFTKDVGVWTNPLKRIIPNFYEEYVKMLVVQPDKPFPILSFDICFGSFLFATENKEFQLLSKKNGSSSQSTRNSNPPAYAGGGGRSFAIPKTALLFLLAALVTAGVVFGVMKSGIISGGSVSLPSLTQPTPIPTTVPSTPTPQPSPTPAYDKAEVKIKVLNGSGTKGLAADAKQAILDAGYEEVLTGNADEFDYTVTEIEVKEEFAPVADDLKKAFADSIKDTDAIKVTTLDEDNTSDVIVTLGADFK